MRVQAVSGLGFIGNAIADLDQILRSHCLPPPPISSQKNSRNPYSGVKGDSRATFVMTFSDPDDARRRAKKARERRSNGINTLIHKYSVLFYNGDAHASADAIAEAAHFITGRDDELYPEDTKRVETFIKTEAIPYFIAHTQEQLSVTKIYGMTLVNQIITLFKDAFEKAQADLQRARRRKEKVERRAAGRAMKKTEQPETKFEKAFQRFLEQHAIQDMRSCIGETKVKAIIDEQLAAVTK